jgi:hypothetical protein
MFVLINDYHELSLEETRGIEGASLAILEAGAFAYDMTH